MDKDLRQCQKCGSWFNKYGLANHVAQAHEGRVNNPNLGRWVSENLKNPKAKYSRYRNKTTNGGIRKGSGRGRKGWYCGIWCDSTWELAWLIYQLDSGVSVARNTTPYSYLYEGVERRFYPDFRLEDGSLVEVKGWMDKQNEAKIAAVPMLVVVGKAEIGKYISYAENKFGKNFYAIACDVEVKIKVCPQCGCPISRCSRSCQKCWPRTPKIDWPTAGELLAMVSGRRFEKTAIALGVSSNAIRKRIKKFGLVAQNGRAAD